MLVAAIAFCLAAVADVAPAGAALPPLVPRRVFSTNPSFANAKVSPDGKTLAYLARSKGGTMNLWVRSFASGEQHAVSKDSDGDLFGAEWAADSRHLLFVHDTNGDENYHLKSLDVVTRQIRDLTPFNGVRAASVLTSASHPRQILVGMNLRNPRVLDMYRVDLESGAVTLDTANPGDVTEWAVDSAFVIRACVALDSTNSNTIIRVRDSARSRWRTLQTWPFLDAGQDRDQRIIEFSRDGQSVLLLSPRDTKTTRFVSVDVHTGKVRDALPSDPRADIWCPFDFAGEWSPPVLLKDERTGAVQAYAVQYLKPEWKVLDPSLRTDFAKLERLHDGVPMIDSRDRADRTWVVRYVVDDGPDTYYLWHRATQKAESLFVNVPEWLNQPFTHTQLVTVRARDGLDLPCYLTVPNGVPPKNLPLIVNPHGGPWVRDDWGFNPFAQWLANRGYAVIQPQFRGSTGFGKAFINASIGEEGTGAMQNDVTDAVKWAVDQGIADPRRVAIEGGSYGGYATLSGCAFTPELYACAVDVVGPSNMKTTIESFPPYWKARRKRWLLRLGDVIADSTLNQRISPLFHVDHMRAPILIGHGVNDPRVKIAESEKIVSALRKKGVPVTFVVYPDEGHGFTRPPNIEDFSGRTEDFLAKYLHGRVEPWKKVDGASAELR
ncbi:MAG TPA: S9 family peptidase [Candidatus Udaeobacter sp.]|nr:S9 family peptidase [Candidatus Udaeobacter sp.]